MFGRGEDNARFVLIGEQPGDQEDTRGEPFAGPAAALRAPDRDSAYAGLLADLRTCAELAGN